MTNAEAIKTLRANYPDRCYELLREAVDKAIKALEEQSLPSAQPEVLACGEGELSAQPEIKPIDYQDCANAMLRMWMDKVVTDGEYNRIMDKLNAFWGTRNERSD